MSRRGHGEGTIFWNEARQRFQASISIGSGPNRKRPTVTGKTRKEVAAKLRELRERANAADLTAGPITIGQLAERWWQNQHGRFEESTQSAQHDRVTRHIIGDARIAKLRIDVLTTDHVEAWLAAKAKAGHVRNGVRRDYSKRYLEMMRSDLNTMVRWAIRRQWVRYNVVTEAMLPETVSPPKVKRSLTLEQARDLIATCQTTTLTLANFVLVTMVTGARPGEVAALRFEDVDPDAGVIHIRHAIKRGRGGRPIGVGPTKTGTSRQLGGSAATVALEAIRRERLAQAKMRLAAGPNWSHDWDGFIFLAATGGIPWPSNQRKALRAIAWEAGIGIAADIEPYELRHSVTSLLTEMGVEVHDIVDQMGWVDQRMYWKHYRHRTDPVIRNPGIAP